MNVHRTVNPECDADIARGVVSRVHALIDGWLVATLVSGEHLAYAPMDVFQRTGEIARYVPAPTVTAVRQACARMGGAS